MFSDIQKDIITKLKADAGLTVLLADGSGSIYDHVPQRVDNGSNNAFPYVALGVLQYNPWATDTFDAFDTSLTIHVWSRKRGRVEAQKINEKIYAALHNKSINSSNFLTLFEFADVFVDDDGITRHGVIRFRIISN